MAVAVQPRPAFQVVSSPKFRYLLGRRRSLQTAMQELVEKLKAEAIKLTSGTVSTAQLRALDHPFARRHGQALIPKLPINLQTRRLQRSLRVMPRTVRGDPIWQVQFTAPYSQFVLRPGGTRKMVARGFWSAMRRYYRDNVKRAIARGGS